MSIPVSLEELPEEITRFGSKPYLLTVGRDARPYAVSVSVAWSGDVLMAGAGRRTAGNVSGNDAVALLWPAAEPGAYSLIVDGWAEVGSRPEVGLVVLIKPIRAVLHVTAD